MASEQPAPAGLLLPTGGAGGPSSTQPDPCTPLSLIDMPAPWLDQLLQATNSEQHLNLFRVCRALRDLVLEQCTLTVEFKLPLEPDTDPAAQAKLVLACQRSSRVELSMSPVQRDKNVSTSATSLLSSAMAAMQAADQGLSSIKRVELMWMALEGLAPPWLTSTCPNMIHLYLGSCPISGLPPATTAIPTCSQVKVLKLHNIAVAEDDSDLVAQWQQQFRALTGLNSLTFEYTASSQLLQGATSIGAQLTHLSFYRPHDGLDMSRLAAWFPNLTQLHLPDTTVDDEVMEAVLSMQHLKQFGCKGFQLQHSYTHRLCHWTQLSVGEVHVASFDRLNLGGVQSLQVNDSDMVCISPCSDLEVTNRVTAAIEACGGIKWTHWTTEDGVQVTVDNQIAHVDITRLAACLPLVASCRPIGLVLMGERPVSLELLAAITQYPGLSSTLRCLKFTLCSFAQGVWQSLLPSLPPGVEHVTLMHCEEFTGAQDDYVPFAEAHVMEVCVRATQPVTVEVYANSRWPVGWRQRVQAAMAAAGHQHVTLVG